jgi:biotin transporter BioY
MSVYILIAASFMMIPIFIEYSIMISVVKLNVYAAMLFLAGFLLDKEFGWIAIAKHRFSSKNRSSLK